MLHRLELYSNWKKNQKLQNPLEKNPVAPPVIQISKNWESWKKHGNITALT